MTKNLTVILGAGASMGSVEPGVTSDSRIVPPVTKDLFLTKFDNILTKYGDVKTSLLGISSNVQNGFSLEDHLKRTIGTMNRYEKLNPHRKRAFNQLPLYLQDLFSYVSRELRFKNYYYNLINALFDEDLNTTFLTLNYDLLLDNAIERAIDTKITGFGSYIAYPKKWILIKPHGSVNWFRQIKSYTQTGDTHESWKSIVRSISILNDFYKDIVFIDLDSQFKEGFVDGIPCYPALAVPNTEYLPIYPIESHKTLLEERLRECENYLIIGFSAYDRDLLQLLSGNVQSVKKLLVVGTKHVGDVYDRLRKSAPVFEFKDQAKVTYDSGFANFVRGDVDVNNFLGSL